MWYRRILFISLVCLIFCPKCHSNKFKVVHEKCLNFISLQPALGTQPKSTMKANGKHTIDEIIVGYILFFFFLGDEGTYSHYPKVCTG